MKCKTFYKSKMSLIKAFKICIELNQSKPLSETEVNGYQPIKNHLRDNASFLNSLALNSSILLFLINTPHTLDFRIKYCQ